MSKETAAKKCISGKTLSQEHRSVCFQWGKAQLRREAVPGDRHTFTSNRRGRKAKEKKESWLKI